MDTAEQTKHLWEVDHDYYCSQAFSDHYDFESWAEYFEENHDADMDYNLVFRWDWRKPDPDDPDSYEHLRLYIMQQRKGRFVSAKVRVTEADETAVLEFLRPRALHLQKLWQPIL